MMQVRRLIGLLGLIALSGCGGGGSSSAGGGGTATNQHNFSGGGNNVVQMTVGQTTNGYINEPLVSVKVCNPSNSQCVTVNNVLVDTGSYGLRLLGTTVSSIGLTAMQDPNNAANTIDECLPFADGFAWGMVSSAMVTVGGETTSSAVPVQVIDDNSSAPAVPGSCQSDGTALDSVGALGANGVMGVGVFPQDCGESCAQSTQYNVYYSCTSAGSCSSVTQALADQVMNPVADFPTDNNGVILQLPAVGAGGAATATGYLVFGIGTESNNGLGSAQVLTANVEGNFTTTLSGSSLPSSFIDSGSNALFFNDSGLTSTECDNNEFYCPTSTAALSATNQGENGAMNDVSFSVANLNSLNFNQNAAFDDIGGPAPSISGFGLYFDWGLPFFYGRTTFFALDGQPADGTTGPYYAY